jgi:prepilin-type N-terminal cleavage/methylation domain-containing protein
MTRGFTLIETLTVVAIFGLLSVGMFSAIGYIYRNNAYVFESAAAVENARRGLMLSLEHIREASYGDDGSYPLGTAATSSLIFYSDVDMDGGVERVRIYILSGTLYRTVTNAGGNPPSYTGQSPATTTIAEYVRNSSSTPLFRYNDSTGTELASPVDVTRVRSIDIEIQTDLNPNRAPNVLTLTGSATLRNVEE